jgi:arsenate reductase-like glutaredoxin family protein
MSRVSFRLASCPEIAERLVVHFPLRDPPSDVQAGLATGGCPAQQDRTVGTKIKKKGMHRGKMTDNCDSIEGLNMLLFGLKTCDTCRKALKLLPEAIFCDLRAQGVPPDVLRLAHARFGAAFLNKRSATWRGLSETERLRPLPELIAAYPALMKRPLIEHDGALYLGWGEDTRRALGVA